MSTIIWRNLLQPIAWRNVINFHIMDLRYFLSYQFVGKLFPIIKYLNTSKVQKFPSFETSSNSQVHIFHSGPVFPSSSLIKCSNSPHTCCPCIISILKVRLKFYLFLHKTNSNTLTFYQTHNIKELCCDFW